jgi:uncharacterized protein (TIGR02246 family)
MWSRTSGFVALALAGLGTLGLPSEVAARKAVTHHTTGCQTISKAQVIELFDHWNRALQTKRAETVVAEYTADATLLPAVQNGPLIGTEAIEQYFTDFLKKSPQAEVNARAIRTGCNIAYDIGLYTFTMDGDQSGTRTQVKARFTLIYAPVNGKWLIAHHHSSADPVASE